MTEILKRSLGGWVASWQRLLCSYLQVSDICMHFGEPFLQNVGEAGLEVTSLSLELRCVELAASFVDDCRPWVTKHSFTVYMPSS